MVEAASFLQSLYMLCSANGFVASKLAGGLGPCTGWLPSIGKASLAMFCQKICSAMQPKFTGLKGTGNQDQGVGCHFQLVKMLHGKV